MTGVTHVAGPAFTWDGRYVRQRCVWCGAALIDVDLTAICVPMEQAGEPFPTWPFDALVRVDGAVRSVVEPEPSIYPGSTKVPDDCCMRLDPAVTA